MLLFTKSNVIRIFILNKKFPSILSKKKMTRRDTVINPETGRAIRIGGDTYNRLIISAYDHINGELVRRESAPPITPRRYYLNALSNRLIRHGTRTFLELIRAGWEIEDDYYLLPPILVDETLAIVREAGHEIAQRRERRERRPENPTTYEGLMAVHGETLANLNISLCRECFYPLKPEEGEYCNDCAP
jgi:hypothetical protein